MRACPAGTATPARVISGMRPLFVILAADSAERWTAAIGLASAHAAHGGDTRLHIDAGAVARLCHPPHQTALDDAEALGVLLSICPTGAADYRIDTSIRPNADRFGLVALLAMMPDDARLVVI